MSRALVTITARLVGYEVSESNGMHMLTLRLRQPCEAYSHQTISALRCFGAGHAAELRCMDVVDRLDTGRTYRIEADGMASVGGALWAMGVRGITLELAPADAQAAVAPVRQAA